MASHSGCCAWCNRWIGASGQPGAALTPEEKTKVQSHGICEPCAKRLRVDRDYIGIPHVRWPSSMFRANTDFGWNLLLLSVAGGLIYLLVHMIIWASRGFPG